MTVANYGSWRSPISAAQAASASGVPQWPEFVDGEVWWAESRPSEGGRVTLLRQRADGEQEELLPAPWNVRNRVHEYGGRPWTCVNGTVVFTNWDDQRVYAFTPGADDIGPITPEPAQPHGVRYADLRAGRAGEVWAVRETATGPGPTDVERQMVALSVAGEKPAVLGASHRFMTSPAPSPDGRYAVWLGWDHPAMPWDTTQLCVAEVGTDGTFGPHRVLAGGAEIAVCQVEWESPDTLLALLDPDGWWNLHRVGLDGAVVNLAPVPEEIGGPLWQLGSRWFVALGGGRFAVLRSGRLAILDEAAGTVTDVPAAAERPSWVWSLAVADGPVVAGVAVGPLHKAAVATVDIESHVLRQVSTPTGEIPDAGYLPVPEERTFTGRDGQDVPAYVFPPTSPDFTAPDGELPPFVVRVHGGPTGHYSPVLDPGLAFFTSRGVGVVAVNYGGSTGYGRRFRERLRGQWGVVDVADCAAVAEALAAEGTADPGRIAISGGSAGGFTAALSATTTRTYAAATVKFPVIDLLGFATGETHDFESRYLDGIVGPVAEHRRRYVDRSPLTHADQLACPVLLQQGLEDEICPPAQAERFVAALSGSGIPHAYQPFAGEQHGFRRAENIAAALEAELSFYGQVFGFATPGVPAIELQT